MEKYDKVVISLAFLMIVVPFVSYTSAHIIAVGYKIKPFVTSSLIDSTGFQYPASVEEKATEILLKPASILTSVYFGTIPTFAYIIYQKWSIKLKEKCHLHYGGNPSQFCEDCKKMVIFRYLGDYVKCPNCKTQTPIELFEKQLSIPPKDKSLGILEEFL